MSEKIEIDIKALAELYKRAADSNDKAAIDAAEMAVAEAMDAEAAIARLDVAEALAAENVR